MLALNQQVPLRHVILLAVVGLITFLVFRPTGGDGNLRAPTVIQVAPSCPPTEASVASVDESQKLTTWKKAAREWEKSAGDLEAQLHKAQEDERKAREEATAARAEVKRVEQLAITAAAAPAGGASSSATGSSAAWRKCAASQAYLGWNDAMYESARSTYADFRALATTRKAWDESRDSALFHLNPDPAGCGQKGRLGPELPSDGGKVTCGFESLPQGCVIYSLGGNLEWSFDEAAVAGTPCDVWVFDCTVDPAAFKHANPRIHPVSACIADSSFVIPAGQLAPHIHLHESAAWDRRFTTIPKLMGELGHSTVHYLKMDIEGAEYEVIAGELVGADSTVPAKAGTRASGSNAKEPSR